MLYSNLSKKKINFQLFLYRYYEQVLTLLSFVSPRFLKESSVPKSYTGIQLQRSLSSSFMSNKWPGALFGDKTHKKCLCVCVWGGGYVVENKNQTEPSSPA